MYMQLLIIIIIIITSNNQRLRSAGDNDQRSKCFCFRAVLCVSFTQQMVKTRVIRLWVVEGPNWSNCVLCIPYILSGSPNECWLHTCDACVITTWRWIADSSCRPQQKRTSGMEMQISTFTCRLDTWRSGGDKRRQRPESCSHGALKYVFN